jgi:hypothetical protein
MFLNQTFNCQVSVAEFGISSSRPSNMNPRKPPLVVLARFCPIRRQGPFASAFVWIAFESMIINDKAGLHIRGIDRANMARAGAGKRSTSAQGGNSFSHAKSRSFRARDHFRGIGCHHLERLRMGPALARPSRVRE